MQLLSFFLFLFTVPSNVADHDLFMSICEIEEIDEGMELRFYLFHDDLKTALYGNPTAPDISPEDAEKYIVEKTKLTVGGQAIPIDFQNLDYRQEQVRLIFRAPLPPGQKIENLTFKNRLLLEYFPAQVNMVYFIRKDGERLVEMLDSNTTEAVF